MEAPDFSDPLARALWLARQRATPLSRDDWQDLSRRRGEAVAAEMYGAAEAAGARPVGAKVGANDPTTQAKLGCDGPIAAPVYGDTVIGSGSVLALSETIAPLVELEIGIVVRPDRPLPLPCVEIIDSRFAGWDVAIAHLLADFGAQGRMMFGSPVEDPPAEVRAEARLDGAVIATGVGRVEDALESLTLVGDRLPGPSLVGDPLVATGSLNVPVPLQAGDWEFDFGQLGVLRLTVVP